MDPSNCQGASQIFKKKKKLEVGRGWGWQTRTDALREKANAKEKNIFHNTKMQSISGEREEIGIQITLWKEINGTLTRS